MKLKFVPLAAAMLAVAVLVGVGGCGAVSRTTGVMTLGPDTYRVAVRASLGDVTESQRSAMSEALAYCKSINREFVVTGTRRLYDQGGGPFEVTFRCLRPGDPDLRRPNMQPVPDTTIQVK